MEIWNRHYEACRASVGVLHGVFDACVLSKPFFKADDVWIYEDDGMPVGFLHLDSVAINRAVKRIRVGRSSVPCASCLTLTKT